MKIGFATRTCIEKQMELLTTHLLLF